tara:strand:- start:180 stop:593 length:414 start_codon:yes stop_codon:yes gene_type:complete
MKVKKATEALTQELGRTPTQNEVSSIVDDSDKVDAIMAASCSSLNVLMAENEELEGVVGEDRTEENDYQMECDMLLSKVADRVSDRDLNMFIFRHGLQGKRPHSLEEIAQFHEVTRSRVHQVTNTVFNEMRELATAR